MRLAKFLKVTSLVGLSFLLINLSPVAYSTSTVFDTNPDLNYQTAESGFLLLADNDDGDVDEDKPRSGSLVLPAASDEEKSEKKCMTVCQRWGQECMIDATRGVRKCRRTCKEFGQECF